MGSCSALSCSIGAKPWREDAGPRFGEVDHVATPAGRLGRGGRERDNGSPRKTPPCSTRLRAG